MTEHRAKGQNLHKPADGQFGMNWVYDASHCPLFDVFQPGFFNGLRGSIRTGDTIRAIRIENNHVREVAEAIVLHVSAKDVIVSRPAIAKFDQPEAEEAAPAEEKPAGFVQGTGEVKWNAGKKVHEVLVNGEAVFATKEKDLAAAVARGDVPIPQPETV